jgi:methionyl-tRNA formyltransferase
MKTLFYGTPEVAVPFLELLAKRSSVAGVVSQPDKPAGRELKIAPTPVKAAAARLGLSVFQPHKPSEIVPSLRALSPDIAVAVAYGRILRADALAVPRLGTLNVHFSLLPKYRGAAPVQWSLARGETRTGVSIFWLDEGMDTGPVQLMRETEIGPDEDAPALMARLAVLGVEALGEALTQIENGEIIRLPQAGEPSLAPLIKKEDARLDLRRPAHELHDLVRGFRSWPRAYLELKTARLIVLKTRVGEPGNGPIGSISRIDRDGSVLIQCAPGSRLQFLSVQPEGKKPVNAADFINGLRLSVGDALPFVE